jgi:hypothetical protein
LSGITGFPSPRLTPRIVWSLLRETVFEWYDDRAPRLGAALAFYTVLALAPGLIVIIALAALLLGHEAAQGQIIDQVENLIGVAGPRRSRRRSRVPAAPAAASSPPALAFSHCCSGSGASSANCRTR